jgi:hypothetical protein
MWLGNQRSGVIPRGSGKRMMMAIFWVVAPCSLAEERMIEGRSERGKKAGLIEVKAGLHRLCPCADDQWCQMGKAGK